ncbi:MAG: arsenate reductase/protein-tyrosine-phosphatase family protein [Halobacteriota archaeon]
MKATKKRILFLCTHNAARSQMAEGFVNSRYSDHYEAFSAGNAPTRVHPCTVKVMAEEGDRYLRTPRKITRRVLRCVL